MTVEWHELSDYLAGELDEAREAELERALFEEPAAASVAATFMDVVEGIAEIRRRHCTLSSVLTPETLQELRRISEPLELELAAGTTVGEHIPQSVLVCVAHVPVDLTGVRRADVELLNGAGDMYATLHDVPLDHAGNRISIVCERHVALVENVTIFRVVAIDGGRRRVLGESGIRNDPPPS